jgi:hypothetical protein
LTADAKRAAPARRVPRKARKYGRFGARVSSAKANFNAGEDLCRPVFLKITSI